MAPATIRYNFSNFAAPVQLSIQEVTDFLELVSNGTDAALMDRIPRLQEQLAQRMRQINARAPAIDGKSTNPFVLAAYAELFDVETLKQVDDIVAAAKVFSSIETAAGRVVEDVLPPFYGWTQVYSPGHTVLSEIDSAKVNGDSVSLVALKSGPMCINDSMVSQIANAISNNWREWADHWGVRQVRYVVGMNYSTAKNSNKKDWHIVRLAEERLAESGVTITSSCINATNPRPIASSFFTAEHDGYSIRCETLQGRNLWEFIANSSSAFLEICWAMMKCLNVVASSSGQANFTTDGMLEIQEVAHEIEVDGISEAEKQWLLLFARHFVDEITRTGYSQLNL